MKKILSILLVLCLLSGVVTLTAFAEEENFIPEGSATFEEGESVWSALGGGTVKITNNPTGEGKVLCYSGIPDKSYASPQIDVRPFILNNVTEETTVYCSIDIYTKNADIVGALIRLRTATADGYSACTAQGKNYCTIGKADAFEDEWSRVTFSMEITEADLTSTEPWNICFDGLSSNTREAIYFDNFYIGLEEDCPYEENEHNGTEDTESESGENKNFLSESNSTFENGTTAWSTLGKGTVSVVDNPNGEGKVLCYYDIDPSVSYATPKIDVRAAIQKNVDEETTIYGSFDLYCEKEISGTLIRLRTNTVDGFSACTAEDKNYCTIGNGSAEAGQWTTVTFSFEIYEEDLESTEPWNICFDGITKYLEEGDVLYIDNVYIGTSPLEGKGNEKQPIPEKTPVSRFDSTLVGTIRWDAFSESTPDGTNPSSQVARVLSPAKYHCQAPFFSVVNEDNTIAFPKYTVETWEKEAEYAVAGGLDYFAYLWYETDDLMSEPRKYHLQSEKKDTIKMCGILEGFRSPKSMKELYEAMKDSCYLRLDGRPVVFLYGIADTAKHNWTALSVEKLRQEAANAGITESLYIVGMFFSSNLTTFADNVAKGIDAISWYSVGATETAQPYADLAAKCEETMEKMGAFALGNNIDIIPAFTAGRDTRARIETGVTWVDGDPNATEDKDKPYANKYSLEPTMEELENHMYNVINYANTMVNAKTNMVLSYGWNEHEEGGWLCPTIMVDADGNPIYNEDGTIKANTERLDALKRAKERALSGATTDNSTATPAPTPNAGASNINVSATPAGNAPSKESTFNILDYWWILPIAVVVIGGAVFAVLKKKKSE